MSYVSLEFLLFTAVCLTVYYIVPQKFRVYILLTASAVFFALFSSYLIAASAALTLLIYFVSIKIGRIDENFNEKKKELSKEERKAEKNRNKALKKWLSAIECTAAFALLALFKYLGFFTGIINSAVSLFSEKGFPILSLVMPIGISYYTLSIVGYAIDVYRGAIKPEKNFAKLFLFTIYFPHLVEGPIGDYKSFSSQLDSQKKLTYEGFMNAFELILAGLVKKMVLADRAGIISSEFFDNFSDYNSFAAFFGMILYAINIYFDFSGCMDIVCGVSELFGIELPQNFRQPFFSKNVQEFWRRWHITLGNWIKKYIFYSVSMSKLNQKIMNKCGSMKSQYYKSTLPMLYSLLFVWLFNGIWHGASWKFILYGLYYYIILSLGLLLEPVFEKICGKLSIDRTGKVFCGFQIVRTGLLVAVGLTLFRAETVKDFLSIISSLFSFSGAVSGITSYIFNSSLSVLDFAVVIFFTAVMICISVKKEHGTDIRAKLGENKKFRWILCTLAVICIIVLGVYGPMYTEQPFVYAQF